MVQYYQIAGQKVGSHYLSIATLSTMFVGAWMLSGGKKAEQKSAGPPMNASSKDEENFIQQFLKEADSKEPAKSSH